MNLLRKHIFLTVLLLVSGNGFCQSKIDSLITSIENTLTSTLNNSSYQIETNKTSVIISIIDTFFLNTYISPLRNRGGISNKYDTLSTIIRFESHWTVDKYDSIQKEQLKIITPLINKSIEYRDSTNWGSIKTNKYLFSECPYSSLVWGYGHLSKKELKQLTNFTRLPDKVIDDIGIFIDSDFNPTYLMIEPAQVHNKAMLLFKTLSDWGLKNIYKTEDHYF